MQPTIEHDDIVTVVPLRDRCPGLGRVVLHRTRGGGAALHRIILSRRCGRARLLRIRGDAFGANSALVDQKDVLGCAMTTERDGTVHPLGGWRPRLRGLCLALRRTLGQRYRNLRRQAS